MDYGFKYKELEGLFSKCDKRRGMVRYEPLDLIWMAQIRRGRERADRSAGTVLGTAASMAGDDGTRRCTGLGP